MQSGISASSELHSAFKDLLADRSQRGLLVTIEKESLVPLSTISSTSSSFHADLANLAPHLKPNAALYILLRQSGANTTSSTSPSFVAVTYVPDAAPVRQKMLFASTRLTLNRELGSEYFAESVFTTTAAELTAEGWRRHEAHVGGEKPLTEEEKNLEGIREAEASEASGAQRRGAGYGAMRAKTRIDDGVVEALSGLEDNALVMLRVDLATESIQLVSIGNNISPSDLSRAISSDEPRYSFYRYTYPSPDQSSSQSAIIFIYSCPSHSPIKAKMLYASSRWSVIKFAEGEAGLEIAKKLEFSDPSDIGASAIEDEFRPKEEQKTAFARPKRPGKR